MPSISQEKLRRLAARSIRVLNRHKEAAPAVSAYVGTLDAAAQAFIVAFDEVHSSRPSRGATRRSGKEGTEQLVKTLRMWLALVDKDVTSFDRSNYLLRPVVTDDVVADGEQLLAVVEDFATGAGDPLPYADELRTDLEAAIDAARADYVSHNASRAELASLLSDARTKAEAFYEELVAFRRTLRAFLGSTHPDFGLLRNKAARPGSVASEDEDIGANDTVEDESATAARLGAEPAATDESTEDAASAAADSTGNSDPNETEVEAEAS